MHTYVTLLIIKHTIGMDCLSSISVSDSIEYIKYRFLESLVFNWLLYMTQNLKIKPTFYSDMTQMTLWLKNYRIGLSHTKCFTSYLDQWCGVNIPNLDQILPKMYKWLIS